METGVKDQIARVVADTLQTMTQISEKEINTAMAKRIEEIGTIVAISGVEPFYIVPKSKLNGDGEVRETDVSLGRYISAPKAAKALRITQHTMRRAMMPEV